MIVLHYNTINDRSLVGLKFSELVKISRKFGKVHQKVITGILNLVGLP